MHIACGLEYRGRKVCAGPVVYIACEGERGLSARTEAYRQEHGITEAEFYLLTTRLDLVGEHETLIADIGAQVDKPVAVVIDTLNRSIRGSESRDEDMGDYVKAADAIREAFKCAVIIIHHCGIEGSRPRGHTSLTGACEAQIAIKKTGDGNVTAVVEYMKDGREGDEIHSKLRVVEVGTDQDGEPITSCVVDPVDAPLQPERGAKLTKNQQSMLTILQDATPSGLTLDAWNEQAREAGLGVKRRSDLMDYRSALKRKQLVHSYGDKWHATNR
jgi:hypothetical protein